MSLSFLNPNLVVGTKLTYKLQKHAGVGTKWVSLRNYVSDIYILLRGAILIS